MKELFRRRLQQLRVHEPRAAVALQLIRDMLHLGETTFEADEVHELRQLLDLQEASPEEMAFAMRVLSRAAHPIEGYVPSIETLRSRLQEEEARRRELERRQKMANATSKAQADAEWLRNKTGTSSSGMPFDQMFNQFFQHRTAFDWTDRVDPRQHKIEAAMKRLELSPGFKQGDLRAAYRKAAKAVHPDTGGSAEAFQQLTSDMELLETVALAD